MITSYFQGTVCTKLSGNEDTYWTIPNKSLKICSSAPLLEHFFPVPLNEPFTRIIIPHLRQRDPFPRKIPEQSLNHPTTIHRIRNHHAHIFIQANRATIKRFVVNRAQRQTIGYFAGTTMLFPSDVSRFKRYGRVIVAHIEATDRALIVVSPQYCLAELRIALAKGVLDIETHFIGNIILNTGREMRLQDLLCQRID